MTRLIDLISAAVSGLINGRSGARVGTAVAAGASLLISGQSLNMFAGTIVESRLSAAAIVPL